MLNVIGGASYLTLPNSQLKDEAATNMLQRQITQLMTQLVECIKFPYGFGIARIPLKFFYEMSETFAAYIEHCESIPDSEIAYADDTDRHGGGDSNSTVVETDIGPQHKDVVVSWSEALFSQALTATVSQMSQPVDVMEGRKKLSDSRVDQLKDWADLVLDCTLVLGGEKALAVEMQMLQV